MALIKIKDYYIPDNDKQYLGYFKQFNHYQEAQRNRALSHVSLWRKSIDIGANIGLWAKDLSNFFDKTICFEPNKNCIDCLKKNINLDKSEVFNVALGDKKSELNLITPTYSGGSSFINKTKIGINDDGSTIYGLFNSEVPKQRVLVKKLDEYNLTEIDFIKIDVQGFEFEVLKGAKETLVQNNPIICIEEDENNTELSETLKFLNKLNYHVIDKIQKEAILKKKS